jgi:multisubunit Na+/H+ antiporter MnhB subunit
MNPGAVPRAGRSLLGAGLAVLGAGLAWAALDRPAAYPGLAPMVEARRAETGADNPVTAVLLDFRGYDTMLEVAVLMVAGAGVLALADEAARAAPPPAAAARTPMHGVLLRLLLPLSVMLGVWMLWAGTKQPGGAFQSGAVLAGAAILAALAGPAPPRMADTAMTRLALALGPVVFLGVALALLALQGRFLAYPAAAAPALMLAIEAAIALSTAATLALVYLLPARLVPRPADGPPR